MIAANEGPGLGWASAGEVGPAFFLGILERGGGSRGHRMIDLPCDASNLVILVHLEVSAQKIGGYQNIIIDKQDDV